ncbi:MAG: hypothetical protein HKN21_01340, partial [Candidatus Eisenbacteria bacterium]|nr:hypothetical protein [Candidatus Eisenbacteria bacterium]
MPSTWLQLLEFDRLREILVSLTSSHLGRESLAELRPFESPRAAEEVMELVDAMVRHTITVSPIPAIDVPDLSSQLSRLTHGGAILTPEALMELGTLLRAISRLHGALKSVEEDSPLKRLGTPLEPKPHLERALDQTFEPSGEIRDGASSDLRRIRRERERTRERLRGRLQKMASDLNGDQIVTLREGRFVLSISQNEQGKVKGLVQDRSNSGQTLFVEPLAVVEENNDLRSKDAEERAEIQKILMALTAKFAQEHEVLNSNYQHLGWLDTMRARARLAQRWQGEPVQFATDSVRLEMSGARHPLLLEARDAARNLKQAREDVIPLALRLDEDHRIMMVTGPNMGGKTVALKCIGLLTAMAQCGCLIPADPGCVLPWLNHWVVDLGDEQSLENDLSTFGAHVKTWGEAIKKAGPRTLVLLDELGSGTDPGEGTALAQSVLEKLVESGGLAIVSTHLSGLKGFAAESEGIENASMRFDPETVHPTFRLEMGVPGESHAIDMARRLGFPEEQVQRAEALLPKQERDLKKLLDDLNLGQRKVREKERELDGLLAEAEADRQKARQKLQRFLDERQELRARAARQARSLLQRAEQDAKQTRGPKQKVDLQVIRKEQARLARLESGVA